MNELYSLNYELKLPQIEEDQYSMNILSVKPKDSNPKLSVEKANEGVNELCAGWEHITDTSTDKEKDLELLRAKIDQETCNLMKCGVFGENILHWALLMHHEVVAKWLIKSHHFLVVQVYGRKLDGNEKNEKILLNYEGEGCLHIAVANRDREMAYFILDSFDVTPLDMSEYKSECPVDRGYPLNSQWVTGHFFKNTGVNSVYYGDTALDFAVSTNQGEMIHLLLGYDNDGDELKWHGKWRASLKLKDHWHQNTVFHIAAIGGFQKVWLILIWHLEATIAAEMTLERDTVEVELAAELWVRSQVNTYGLTPLQVAAYKNNRKMVKCIFDQTRLRLWKWGEKAFYGYPLNEVDEYFSCPRKTPGIPINNIILCEGHFEMLELPLIERLLEKKWNDYGMKWVAVFGGLQVLFCSLVTALFIVVVPHLDDPTRPWGISALDKWWKSMLYVIVMMKAAIQCVEIILEMVTLTKANMARYSEVLRQKQDSILQHEEIRSKYEHISERKTWPLGKDFYKAKNPTRFELTLKAFKLTICLYFERDFGNIPAELQNMDTNKRANISVLGIFLVLSWISNFAFVVAHFSACFKSERNAQVLLVSMMFILICEYMQLFLWFQTWRQVGRFISSVVNILWEDVLGFLVVFLIILIAFSACFFLLNEGVNGWWDLFFSIYELSVGTGEWFKDIVTEMEDESPNMNSCRKALIYLIYMFFVAITLVILMNLLIAVMSETAISLTMQTEKRALVRKLSSVSLISRRLRGIIDVLNSTGKMSLKDNTIGGQTGTDLKILNGRLTMKKEVVDVVKEKSYQVLSKTRRNLSSYEEDSNLEEYYNEMRFWTVLEHEPLISEKDARMLEAGSRGDTVVHNVTNQTDDSLELVNTKVRCLI